MEGWLIAVIVVTVVVVVFLILFLSLWYTIGGGASHSSSAVSSGSEQQFSVPEFAVLQFGTLSQPGVTFTASVAQGTYSGEDLAHALEVSMNASYQQVVTSSSQAFFVTYDAQARAFVISSSGFEWRICSDPSQGQLTGLMGFPTPAPQTCQDSYQVTLVGQST